MKKDKRQKKNKKKIPYQYSTDVQTLSYKKKHYINQFIGRKIFVSKKRKQQLIELIQFLTNLSF